MKTTNNKIPGVILPPNEAAIGANNANKLNGTDGQTMVLRHIDPSGTEASVPTANTLLHIQSQLGFLLGEKAVKSDPQSERRSFAVIQSGRLHSATSGFVPIKNLHTTISAQYVVDSRSDAEFGSAITKTKLRMVAKKHLNSEESTVFQKGFDKIEQLEKEGVLFQEGLEVAKQESTYNAIFAHLEDLAQDQSFENLIASNCEEFSEKYREKTLSLKPNALKVVPNGAVLVEWDGGSEMTELKRDLAKLGGTLKYGTLDNPPPNVGTTIGFIPTYDQMSPADHSELSKEVANLAEELNNVNLSLKPVDLYSVTFRRNDLNPAFSLWQPLLSEEGVQPRSVRGIQKP